MDTPSSPTACAEIFGLDPEDIAELALDAVDGALMTASDALQRADLVVAIVREACEMCALLDPGGGQQTDLDHLREAACVLGRHAAAERSSSAPATGPER